MAVLAVPVSALVEIALRWLVRAFSGDQPTPWSYFSHELCGTRLWVGGMSEGTRALRTPLVVFLQSAPASADPIWFPGPSTEGGPG